MIQCRKKWLIIHVENNYKVCFCQNDIWWYRHKGKNWNGHLFYLACIFCLTEPNGREYVCIPIRHDFKSLAYITGGLPRAWSLQKQDSMFGVNTHWEKHIAQDEDLFSLCTNRATLIQKTSSKIIDVLLNAKSRYVGWRLCKSLWVPVLAEGNVSDGQHRKHAGPSREKMVRASVF